MQLYSGKASQFTTLTAWKESQLTTEKCLTGDDEPRLLYQRHIKQVPSSI